MDMSNSQYNSESESGWTNYFNHSSFSEKHFHRKSGKVEYEGKGATMEEEEEEEDLSMVSDASSGPPHYHVEEDYQQQPYCVNWHSSSSKESKKKVKEYGRKSQQPSPLDDTASSPVLNYPKMKVNFPGNGAVENTLDFPPSFSATRIIKRKTKLQKHSSFLERSLGGKQASEEPGGCNEEERK
ncbi:uncharacterized protein [Cicer arietinum]|uniref:Uncharacterized protein LOC101498288 isoform X2 n=1 Tax=Cicer arietinum TaxID=3827 RepID=A0A1S2Y9J1_CICAR|nr:uncharacterized protein LOC101498288 isoform X2 [Cicer arietinum]